MVASCKAYHGSTSYACKLQAQAGPLPIKSRFCLGSLRCLQWPDTEPWQLFCPLCLATFGAKSCQARRPLELLGKSGGRNLRYSCLFSTPNCAWQLFCPICLATFGAKSCQAGPGNFWRQKLLAPPCRSLATGVLFGVRGDPCERRRFLEEWKA